MQKIPAHHLVFFDEFTDVFPLGIDLVYAQPTHPDNYFGSIYAPAARLLGHRDLAAVLFLASYRLGQDYGWRLILKDCLRVVEAQDLMTKTPIVQANPHWLVEPRFLSTPGNGGHPRGMAIDVGAYDSSGVDINFGTRFDYFSASTDARVNKAHRAYADHEDDVKLNRTRLEQAMVQAAIDLNFTIYPLPHEWWDFRFPSSYSNEFTPIHDADLPDGYKMTVPNTVRVATDDSALEYLRLSLGGFVGSF